VSIRSKSWSTAIGYWSGARWSGQGAGSEVPIEMEMAQVCTIENGKVRRIEEYMDRGKAL
jgi:ketosteroid isomerase-like protein